jgi:uncharacterized protein (DUF1810 family)
VTDAFELSRFVEAQTAVYEQALAEIRSGRKRSHWMWFIFPQAAGLGSSPASQHFGIRSRAEAEAYLAHPVLGPRLIECAGAVLALHGVSASDVFGYPDDMKLRSCATLFAQVSQPASVFQKLLDKYFESAADPRTLELI